MKRRKYAFYNGNNKCIIFGFSLLILVLSIYGLLMIASTLRGASAEHVYYGYVPPSTDIENIDELINGEIRNYTPPPGTALLDIIGTEDNTKVEVYDISTGEKIVSITVDRLEKKTLFIPYGTYFKVVSNKRVIAHLVGGNDGPSMDRGEAGFYPSVEGGFRGKEFIFIPMSVSDSYVTGHSNGYNAYILGLTKADFELVDSSGVWSSKSTVDQHGAKMYLLWGRINHGDAAMGAGNSMIFHLTASDDVMVASMNSGALIAVPAVTGGFVGKLFLAPVHMSFRPGVGTAGLLIIPCEPGKVEIYDASSGEKVAEKSFSESDVAQNTYWFRKFGQTREKEYIIKSTGNIVVYTGVTDGSEDPQDMGPDVTIVGARPNELIKVFVPTIGIIFAPEDVKVTIDGVMRRLKKDEFTLLDMGVHSIKADAPIIIELVCTKGTPWAWGEYLIEPADILKSYEIPEGFGEIKAGLNITMIVGIAVVVIIVALAVFIMMRRRRR